MFAKKESHFPDAKLINPFPPKKATLTIEVDLVTQQCAVRCDQTLPALMLASILCQCASGTLMEAMRVEAMTVGRGPAFVTQGEDCSKGTLCAEAVKGGGNGTEKNNNG